MSFMTEVARLLGTDNPSTCGQESRQEAPTPHVGREVGVKFNYATLNPCPPSPQSGVDGRNHL